MSRQKASFLWAAKYPKEMDEKLWSKIWVTRKAP